MNQVLEKKEKFSQFYTGTLNLRNTRSFYNLVNH